MLPVWYLTQQIREAGVPIDGVSDNGDGTYRIDYKPEATSEQRTQAEAIVAAFDPIAILAAEEAERLDRIQVVASLTNELAWLDTTIPNIGTMTNVQVRDVVKRLAQENRGVIHILVWLAKSL